MKLYIVSGLGADFSVLQRLDFGRGMEPVFLDWLIPAQKESFASYVRRMAGRIDDSEPFCLLGYSFGGIVVQEIHRLKPAQKVVILGSIRSHAERSRLMWLGAVSRVPKFLPERFYGAGAASLYIAVRRFFAQSNPRLLEYFQVRDPRYLQWSVRHIVEWKAPEIPGVIQIMADRDKIFPLKNSRPDFVVKNASHLFPATKFREVSAILNEIFAGYS